MSDWLIDAADLLSRPDPGPTPWLVEGLIVEAAITIPAGRWKTTKTWAALEMSISVSTGTPAFGTCEIPNPGPVIYVIEEAGEVALQRRLDALCRGRGIHPDDLRGKLLLSPNRGVKLDDPDWHLRLYEAATKIKPRAFVFDPLARMKGAGRVENDQSDMAPLIEFVRALRDETQAAQLLVAHTGHQGDHVRGTSDLESVWESRLWFQRDVETRLITIKTEHREAGEDDSSTVAYALDWNSETRTMRLRSTMLPTETRIVDWLTDNVHGSTDDIAKAIGVRRTDVKRALDRLSDPGDDPSGGGTVRRRPVRMRDGAGRVVTSNRWILSIHAESELLDDPSGGGTDDGNWSPVPVTRPGPIGPGGTDGTDGTDRVLGEGLEDTPRRPIPGDDNYLQALVDAFENGHITEQERDEYWARYEDGLR